MVIYADGVMLLNFLVDALLIMGTNRLTGYPVMVGRAAAAAAMGGLYSGICLLPGFRFLGGNLWRIASLMAMSGIAFGWNRGSIRRALFFVLLSLALGGMAIGFGGGSLVSLIASVAVLILFCVLSAGGGRHRRFAMLELRYRDQYRRLTALVDTGNLLKDPVSGENVTVLGANIAREMLGFSREQLLDPIGTMTKANISGLRLIPYRSVGRSTGMLLGVSMDKVEINGESVGKIVAFTPEIFEKDGFEALIGGVI